jgi:methyltransferase (TIGR00027 family)
LFFLIYSGGMVIVDEFAANAAQRSPSAEMVAVMRAAHQVIDAQPLIHADPLAMDIIGARARRWFDDNQAFLHVEYVRRIRGMVAIRSRVCEDELRRAVERGTSQYVLLGAGLDTFAYRSPEMAGRLTVFEVDQPATQQWKLERLREAGIETPANLRFVPVDFNAGTLAVSLASAGFDRGAPASFAWLGVSYYLPRESIVEMLQFMAGQGTPSQVVFDIALEESAVPADFLHLYRELRDNMARSAEPWRTWFTPEDILGTLRELGFADVTLLDSQALNALFIEGRKDDLLPGPVMALIVARTG